MRAEIGEVEGLGLKRQVSYLKRDNTPRDKLGQRGCS